MRLIPEARDVLAQFIARLRPQDPESESIPDEFDFQLADEILAEITEREPGDPIKGMRYLGDGTYRVGPLRGQRVRSALTGRFKKGQSPGGAPDAP